MLSRPVPHRSILWLTGAALVWGLAGAGCQPSDDGPNTAAPAAEKPDTRTPADTEEPPMTFTLTSPAFENNGRIPRQYTGEGKDASPPLAWANPPEGTKSFALVCDDPDAPVGTWDHWLIWNLPRHLTKLPEGVPTSQTVSDLGDAVQGNNSWPKIGYGGPMPPPGHGNHHYNFVLYALDTDLDLDPGAKKDALMQAMEGHILGKAELTGLYSR